MIAPASAASLLQGRDTDLIALGFRGVTYARERDTDHRARLLLRHLRQEAPPSTDKPCGGVRRQVRAQKTTMFSTSPTVPGARTIVSRQLAPASLEPSSFSARACQRTICDRSRCAGLTPTTRKPHAWLSDPGRASGDERRVTS